MRDFPQSEQAELGWGQRGVGVLGLGLLDQAKLLFCWDQRLKPLFEDETWKEMNSN